jgi:hypothetical protein
MTEQEASRKTATNRSMFSEGFTERRDLEQYFWTTECVHKLMYALRYQFDPCCLGTPSLAHAWHFEENRSEWLFDIDERFNYLPKFRYFDIRSPENQDETFRVVICDPPFFYIPLEQIFAAVEMICKGDFSTKILIGFLKREEATLLKTFAPFRLSRTNFSLEYAHVKSNKWTNYALYSNIDLPGIKRIRK